MSDDKHDIRDLMSYGCSSFHALSCTDNISEFIDTLKKEKDPTEAVIAPDYLCNTALHYAASTSSYQIAEFFLSLAYQNTLKNAFGLTPAHYAAEIGDIEMLNIFRKAKPMFEEPSFCGWLPIHFAVYYNKLDAIKIIVDETPLSVNAIVKCIDRSISTFPSPDYIYKSPLDIAIVQGNKEIIEYLETVNALPTLHAAVATHDLQAVTYYLSKPELKSKYLNAQFGPRKVTPLHVAAALGDAQVCYTLIYSGCSTALRDADGFSPLEAAVMSQSRICTKVIKNVSDSASIKKAPFIAATLMSEDVCVGLIAEENKDEEDLETGDSILMKFLRRGFIKASEKILNLSCDILHKNKEGMTCMHIAVMTNATEIMGIILNMEKGIKLIHEKDNYDRTPLMYAFLNKSFDSARILLTCGAKVNLPDKFGMTPFALSCALGFFYNAKSEYFSDRYTINFTELCKSFDVEYKDVERPTYGIADNINYRPKKFTLLDDEVLEKLKNAAAIFPNLKNGTIFHVGILMNASVETMQAIMAPARHLAEMPDGDGMFPIHTAAYTKSNETLAFLLRANSNVNVQDNKGNSVFHYLDDDSMIEQVKYIYENYTTIPNYPNNDGDYAIHIACRKNASHIVKIHVEYTKTEEIINLKNNSGETPIDCAIKADAFQAINVLYSKGIKNPLIEAVCEGNKEKVLFLLAHGLSIESTDSVMMTPLHHAAERGDEEMVKLLLDKGASRNAISKEMYTPLHYGAISGNKEVCLLIGYIPFNFVEANFKKQPYFLCEKNFPLKKLLFRLWERCQYCLKLNEALLAFKPTLTIGIKYAEELIEKKTLFDDVLELYVDTANSFSDIIDRFNEFVHFPDAFLMSLHHVLMQFIGFKCKTFIKAFVANVKQIIKINRANRKVGDIFLFMNLIHYISLVHEYLNSICVFPADEYDNKQLIDRALEVVNSELSSAHDAIRSVRGTIMSALKLPENIRGNPIFVSNCVISDVVSKPHILFNSDFNKTFHRVFKATMPRMFPFRTHQKLTITSTSEIVLFASENKSFIIPRDMIYSRALKGNNEIFISTPVCSFRVKFSEDKTGANFLTTVGTRALLGSIKMSGLSGLYDKDTKLKTYECIVAYQVPTNKLVTVRMMTIRAVKSDACIDVARSHIEESESSQILDMTVNAHECKDVLISL